MASEAPNVPESVRGAPRSPDGVVSGREEGALPLRLAVARGGLGVELNRALAVGPLELCELVLALPGLKYPVDLSKGVKQFRSRRGVLSRVRLTAVFSDVGAFLAARLVGLLGEPLLGARAWPLLEAGGLVCGGLGLGLFSQSRSLAFDLLYCEADGVRCVLDNVRGSGLTAPALGLALQVVDSLLGRSGESLGYEPSPGAVRAGRVITFSNVPLALSRAILPDLGFRLPKANGLFPGPLEVHEGRLELSFDVDGAPPEPSRRALLALEAALRLSRADDLLAQGSLDDARDAYVEAQSQTPGFTLAALALADIDRTVDGREEAAFATLEELGGADSAGALGAQVLSAAGHEERARRTFVDAAATEPFGPLSAQLLCEAAGLAAETGSRVLWLDRAVASAPNLPSSRWLRFEDRVRRGDIEGALADGQHLEAAAAGAQVRHSVCLRAGRRLAEAGHLDAARRFLEKALRYAPDDAAARAALGKVFAGIGLSGRAVALLQGALTPTEQSTDADFSRAPVLVDLAKVLAEAFSDLPAAIARLRQVTARAPEAAEARALEAEYAERLGDRTGASLAYARLREAVELGWARGELSAQALQRGARYEESNGDVATAERHLRAAIGLRPDDRDLAAEFRRVAELSHAQMLAARTQKAP